MIKKLKPIKPMKRKDSKEVKVKWSEKYNFLQYVREIVKKGRKAIYSITRTRTIYLNT